MGQIFLLFGTIMTMSKEMAGIPTEIHAHVAHLAEGYFGGSFHAFNSACGIPI
jgi:hypothetical protein